MKDILKEMQLMDKYINLNVYSLQKILDLDDDLVKKYEVNFDTKKFINENFKQSETFFQNTIFYTSLNMH